MMTIKMAARTCARCKSLIFGNYYQAPPFSTLLKKDTVLCLPCYGRMQEIIINSK